MNIDEGAEGARPTWLGAGAFLFGGVGAAALYWLEDLYEETGVLPTPEQAEILLSDKRFVLVAGGEQAGKSVVASLFLMLKFFELPDTRVMEPSRVGGRRRGRVYTHKPALYWLVGATYGETEREFRYLVEWFGALGLLEKATKRCDPGRIVLTDGTRIETKSGVDHRTLSKESPDGIIGCEASQLDSAVFSRMRGRVTPSNGWIFLAGTFESSVGWYPQLFKAWRQGGSDRKSFSLPSWTNRAFYPGGRDDPQLAALRADSTDDFFMERIAGRPVPPRGLVVPEIRPDAHVRDVSYIPGVPVRLAIDPGYAGAYAVEALQYIDGREVIIDEIYERTLVTEEVIEMAKSRPWWPDVEGGVIDVAGHQHHSMPAPAEAWAEQGGVILSASRVRINDGTQRLRSFLKVPAGKRGPKLLIGSHCKGILSELGVTPNPFDGQTRPYRWKTDREGNMVGRVPEDRYNHAIKAVIYHLVDKYGYASRPRADKFLVKRFA